MNDFTASNGIPVHITDGVLYVENEDHTYPATLAVGDHVEAIREFFQAERDAELGRWRTPRHPEYVAYGRPDGYVTILREVDASRESFLRQDVENPTTFIPLMVARAYFDAHPEPKPWDDAKFGEVWLLRFEADDNEFAAFQYGDGRWKAIEGGFPNPDLITSGRRIWPEVSA